MRTKIWIFILLLFTLISCKTSLEECNCSKLEIYGFPSSSILTPIRVTAKSMLESEPYIITQSERIKTIKRELMKLESTEYVGDVDNRFLLKLNCNRKNNITVESNSYLTKINSNNFEPTDEFINLIVKVLKGQE